MPAHPLMRLIRGQFPLFAKETRILNPSRLRRRRRLGQIHNRPIRQLGRLAGIVQIVQLTKGKATVHLKMRTPCKNEP